MKKNFFIIGLYLLGVIVVLAAPNIDPTKRWAWNDSIGWIDFQYSQNPNAEVTASELRGYASSSVGFISVNCASGPPGSNCNVNYKVTNDGTGNLSGWGWNDQIGWISFNCANTGTCATANYQVTIDTNGDFNGWAWNDVVGWISFNCANTGTCGTVNYKVNTNANLTVAIGELISSTFDTATTSAFYTITYQGTKPAGTNVKFQFASSNCQNGATNVPLCNSGDWSTGFKGPDGSGVTYYIPTGPNTPIEISTQFHNNHRYFRYQVILESDVWRTLSPQVDDILIGWSR